MALQKIKSVSGKCVAVPGDDIDTDQIIPARFLKCVTFEGLGPHAFYDLRFSGDGKSKGHPLDRAAAYAPSILISGSNFGCGSSREHAPQALYYWGIRAIVAESFAEIFFGNSIGIGIPCVTLTRGALAELCASLQADPQQECHLDLQAGTLRWGARSEIVGIPSGARQALLEGRWDPLADLLDDIGAVRNVAKKCGYV